MNPVQRRILTIRLLEKMEKNKSYPKKLGIVNISTFEGHIINQIKLFKQKGLP